ncbi:hypothetical protein A3B45_00310 [Candidatus Daviesbacteria bacterium RIFCSPLOWO2_01_FULL_39_12]|uniref:NAD-dependent epimerase/dehydratase domain-containing protein n=1 Tax=Candidatus Daviesbacteria bacterium RIFCSPLOWO2_01_FULL_39_12 TaxID=1797785 RepID=A0A1F5KNY9_9BACT|nr:MAG: hypothetical protein A3B45_00310 [Candidatus Daviesbacteria bacterium RIFCSPLOWO2_01_FULL_39_12]
MSKIIVIGGAGFIGSHLVDALLDLKHQLIVIDDFSTGKKENLRKSSSRILLIREPILLTSGLLNKIPLTLKGADCIYHLAALPRIERSIDDPLGTHRANVEGTLVALELARKLGVKRFIYTSSSSVYGIQKRLPLKESFIPNPQNPYAYQKLMGEYYCQLYSQIYNLPVTIFRLFNVYGPRMISKGSYKLVFIKWLEQKKKNIPLSIYGSGEQTRDFTYISDAIDGLMRGRAVKEHFDIFNLGGGSQISIENLAKFFNHPTIYLPERLHEEKFKEADISKAKRILAWKPSISISEGVGKFMDYYGI